MTSSWRFNEGSPAKSSSKTSHRHRTGPSSCCKARLSAGGTRGQEGRRPSSPHPSRACGTGQKGPLRVLLPPTHPSVAPAPRGANAGPHGVAGGQRRTRATRRGCRGPPRALCLPPTAQTSPWLHFGFSRSFLFLIIREKQSRRAFELHNSLCKRGTGRPQPRPRRALHPLPLCPAKAKVLLPAPFHRTMEHRLHKGERD